MIQVCGDGTDDIQLLGIKFPSCVSSRFPFSRSSSKLYYRDYIEDEEFSYPFAVYNDEMSECRSKYSLTLDTTVAQLKHFVLENLPFWTWEFNAKGKCVFLESISRKLKNVGLCNTTLLDTFVYFNYNYLGL